MVSARNDWTEETHFRSDADRGSRKLLIALMRAQGTFLAKPKPRKKYPPRPEAPFPPHLVVARIQRAAADYYCFHGSYFYLEGRRQWYARPRQVVMFIAHRLCGVSLPSIGKHFGKDHTTILHGCRAVEANPQLMHDAQMIANKLTKTGDRAPFAISERPESGVEHVGNTLERIYA